MDKPTDEMASEQPAERVATLMATLLDDGALTLQVAAPEEVVELFFAAVQRACARVIAQRKANGASVIVAPNGEQAN